MIAAGPMRVMSVDLAKKELGSNMYSSSGDVQLKSGWVCAAIIGKRACVRHLKLDFLSLGRYWNTLRSRRAYVGHY